MEDIPLKVGDVKVLTVEDARELIFGPELSLRENALISISIGCAFIAFGLILLIKEGD
jgi:hypothetical protein